MCGPQQKSVLGILGLAAGILAVLSVIGFWMAESRDGLYIFTSEHFYRDSVMLFLASFWLRWAGKSVACHKMGGCSIPGGEKDSGGKCCA